MENKIYKVKGMHCASCSAIITKKISKLDGVKNVDVNYATEKANIDFDGRLINLDKMNAEIEKLGYTMSDSHEKQMDHSEHLGLSMSKNEKEQELATQKAKTQFVLPLALFIFVIMMWDISSKTFSFVPNLPIQMELFNIISMVLSTVVIFWIGKPFVSGVARFIKYRVANMDTLIGIGTLTAYIYSTLITLFPQIRILMRLPEYTYFDVVIVVIGFITLGKYLEARSKQKTGEAIEKLLELQAKTALVIRDGLEVEIPISEVLIGEIIIVKPGAKIPVDGKIIEGNTSIDESMITGESIPVDKKMGDIVIGATINKQGNIQIEATKVGGETMLAQIIKMVEEAQGSKAPIQAMADKISSIFVPVVLGIAFVTLIIWLVVGMPILGQSLAISYGILSFVGILIIACPCALGLATPTAIIVGVGKGALNGILIKNAESLELLSKVDTVVLDKTGTITKGKPEVTDIIILDKIYSENDILKLAGSIEKLSEHPLAQAISDSAITKNITLMKASDFISLEGVGVKGKIDDKNIYIHRPAVDDNSEKLKELQEQGKTVVIVEVDNNKIGLIALSDTIKDEAVEAIAKLHKRGIKVIMLTGDNHSAAEYIAKQVNIDSVFSEVLPNEKSGKIKSLQSDGKIVAMAGDGINDAPALVQANVGIAMATGSDIAIESAGIALLGGDIHKISQAIDLSKSTMRTIRQNLFWAFIYNIVGIPIAAGLLYPIWGIILNPIFAGLAMAFSSVSVVGNSLRLKTKKI
ncbi:TPA: cadmium-translocating P-type ATPase [Candidatus Nomurabacteria bacterium]|nr:MAG: ATPase, E1-E2 type:Copper-translocating P-type ATPase:Heavy metal translocating P-type ATPase [Candidatus Nomurabacteria bacterium GW2011_GWE2_36_115]KKP94522.1 MAG: ATPase, E1-E2 type:Copper-translocating P-type ATPase:Heavy metal translocating P-type ATPase [Candidatus Nomurabacteria bacterium GW2011_GWF2_36_126]KKP96984.1 MAG: ATPase, E1-E2 type:Copper-translocating P-type ATPase:Heavy metal translocating P-type ATPase [Candidatus Nomurabacteria bacterium GW2011_GWD2_36_14]KKP99412.1 